MSIGASCPNSLATQRIWTTEPPLMPQSSLNSSPAKIIVVAALKGGVSATTTSALVSSGLALRGFKVALIDADPQGAAKAWIEAAPVDKKLPLDLISMPAAGRSLSRELEALSRKYDVLVVDSPKGVREEAPLSALSVATLALLPTRAAPPDVRACMVDTSFMVQQARRLNPSLQHKILCTFFRKTNIATNLLAVMESAGAPLLHNRIGDRTAYQVAAGVGSVPALMGSAYRVAAEEVDLVVNEICELLFGEAR